MVLGCGVLRALGDNKVHQIIHTNDYEQKITLSPSPSLTTRHQNNRRVNEENPENQGIYYKNLVDLARAVTSSVPPLAEKTSLVVSTTTPLILERVKMAFESLNDDGSRFDVRGVESTLLQYLEGLRVKKQKSEAKEAMMDFRPHPQLIKGISIVVKISVFWFQADMQCLPLYHFVSTDMDRDCLVFRESSSGEMNVHVQKISLVLDDLFEYRCDAISSDFLALLSSKELKLRALGLGICIKGLKKSDLVANVLDVLRVEKK
jgi:hypothetical protein